ncbi:MAG: hypothetical protein ACF788_03235, partial [Novipirellula sp. JB048]
MSSAVGSQAETLTGRRVAQVAASPLMVVVAGLLWLLVFPSSAAAVEILAAAQAGEPFGVAT